MARSGAPWHSLRMGSTDISTDKRPSRRSRVRGRRHPGVVLIKPERRNGWRARYVDPDSGRTVKIALDLTYTAEQRTDWAIKRSKALAVRRLELEGGALVKTGTGFDDALDRYFKDHEHLRPRTLATYKSAADKLRAWAKRTSLRSADDLNRPKLMAFRAELLREKRNGVKRGGKRGAREATEKARSPWSVNRELRAVRTVLGYLHEAGLLPRVTSDDLRIGLKHLKADIEKIDYRKPHELQKLLDAALRHDADVFKATREEHAGNGTPGSTRRYAPIAPLLAAATLTGMRAGELRGLTWDLVDLEAADRAGEIEITAKLSKTHKRRTVKLEVSPALRRLLAAMHVAAGRPREGSVFGLTEGDTKAAEKRLLAEYGAPRGSNLQALRRTCSTYLTNSQGLFGDASVFRSAKQLGHSVAVAEKHYAGVVNVPRDARTLEAALQIEKQIERVTAGVGATPKPVRGKRETLRGMSA